MARPLRIEFAGALYHVTSRGDRREDIYLDDDDRRSWLSALDTVCTRFNWVVHAYCQMSNHYHLVVETPDGDLSKGMRQTDWLLSHFALQCQRARRAFLRFVMDGVGTPNPLDQVQHQILLGDPAFVAKIHDAKPSDDLREVSKAHRRAIAKPLAHYRSTYVDRDAAMVDAYATGAYTMKEIGELFGVHYMTVSRAVRRLEERPRSAGKEKGQE